MKSLRLFILIMVGLCASMVSAQSTVSNLLTTKDIEGAAGTEVSVPVYLTNADEVVGAQFDIALPYALKGSVALAENRKDGHSVSCKSLGSNTYRIVVMSFANNAIKGNSGLLLRVPMTVSASAQAGNTFPVKLSNVILTKKNGQNVATETGHETTFMVLETPSPDLVVKSISADAKTVVPGDTLTISWQINNAGDAATTGGWSEHITLVSADGATKTLIGTLNYNSTIDANAVMSRQAELVVPQLLGIEGDAKLHIRVAANSDSGERVESAGNNEAYGNETLTVGKSLFIELPSAPVIESPSTEAVRCRLSRSGNWDMEETFSLTATADSRITMPTEVTIPKGQSGAYFYVVLSDNEILDNDSIVNITAKGGDYASRTEQLIVEDNEYQSLSVTCSVDECNEGDVVKLTIEREFATMQPVVVNLTSDNTKRLRLPASVTIPAGEKTIVVEAQAVDDNIPDASEGISIVVSANRYNSGDYTLFLYDNDLPEIELVLTPSTISEYAGNSAISAKIRRLTNINNSVTIKLSDDSKGRLTYSAGSFKFEEGETEKEFTIGVINNTIVDNVSDVTITAGVYVSSCNCIATTENVGNTTASLKILDDDGPALTMTSTKSALKEGGSDATVLTITRNTDMTNALVVTLTSSDEGALACPQSVTIPAGKSSVSITVTTTADESSSDDKAVTLIATADGHTDGTCWILISDQTLPDATLSDLKVSATEIMAEDSAEITLTVCNDGAAVVPELTKVFVYLDDTGTKLTTFYTQEELAVGGKVTMTKKVKFPNLTGEHKVYAVVNEEKAVKELVYSNNTSEFAAVKMLPKFTATVMTDKSTYLAGDTIVISGQVAGDVPAGSFVEVYVINNGIRYTLEATTDEDGKFKKEWMAYSNMAGHFNIGACYPDEKLESSQVSFDIYGMERVGSSYVTCETTVGEEYVGSIELKNPGNLPLTGVKAEVLSAPANCKISFGEIGTLTPTQEVSLTYSITPSEPTKGNDWEKIEVRLTSNEGAFIDLPLYNYSRLASGQLRTNITDINTTMTKGSSRVYSFKIINAGKGETGKITLSLPDVGWMKSLTPVEMGSLKHGEETEVILQLTPKEDMLLNYFYTGQIALNCENGEGVTIPYRIEPVSESTGTLTVDVCDEFTYYNENKPHVANATVIVKHPVTNSIVAQGVTGSNGLYSVDLPEGHYVVSVTAEKHDPLTVSVEISAGRETKKVVNLSYQAIEVKWNVEETEVEDEYILTSTVEFETNVPAPVVVINGPSRIDGDSMGARESKLLYFTLTNKGLVTADSVEFAIPESNSEWQFKALSHTKPFKLAPQQSVQIPVVITRYPKGIIRQAGYTTVNECMAAYATYYRWLCGKDIKTNATYYSMALRTCRAASLGSLLHTGTKGFWGLGVDDNDESTPPGNTAGGYGGPGSGTVTDPTKINYPDNSYLCDEEGMSNAMQIPNLIIDSALRNSKTGEILKEIEDILDDADENGIGPAIFNKLLDHLMNLIADHFIPEYLDEAYDLLSNIEEFLSSLEIKQRTLYSEGKNLDDEYLEACRDLYDQLVAITSIYEEILGDKKWCCSEESDVSSYLYNLCQRQYPLDVNDVIHSRPESVSKRQVRNLVARFNNTYKDADESNKIDFDKIREYVNLFNEIELKSKELGYETMFARYEDSHELYSKFILRTETSVCSSITLQFRQTMVMTRQAFRGTLSVLNGHESTEMKNVKLSLEISDENGVVATANEFQVNMESLENFTGNADLNSNWALAPSETGIATVLFIPTKNAAPTEAKDYSFGGTLSYVDPYTGYEVTRQLTPVTLTVKPSPLLNLEYFMQRNVMGDNPLTLDVVEPMEPAEFSLLINNVGYGDATNVRMVTEQPEIIDNEKGLLIDFELLSSQLNGKDVTLALGGNVTTEFGTILAQSTSYAQWKFQSTLLGHFTDYKVEATHVTSYGNEELSLLNNVKIHELIHSLKVKTSDNDTLAGFLVNDIADIADLPDMIYLSDATVQKVHVTAKSSIVKNSNTEYVLTVTPKAEGWNYGFINDPTRGNQNLIKIVRQSDGEEIDCGNFWQTYCTLIDGLEPLYGDRLHFADKMGAAEESYVLTFEDRPSVLLAVESYSGVPAENEILVTPLQNVTVRFNKNVNSATFTTEDLTLNCQGVALDESKIKITKKSESEFDLDLSEVSTQEGYYVLTVKTDGIADNDGFYGKNGKSTSWTQFKDGMVNLTVKVTPENAGTTSPSSGYQTYKKPITLSATPAEGYYFACWKRNGEVLSEDPVIEYVPLANAELVAEFKPEHYFVKIIFDPDRGLVDGYSWGYYEYGDELSFEVTPIYGYDFGGWVVNDSVVDDMDLMKKFIVSCPTDLTIRFTKMMGDANYDRKVSVTDITATVNHILENESGVFISFRADMDDNGSITVTDVTRIVSNILNGEEVILAPVRRLAYGIELDANRLNAQYGRATTLPVNLKGDETTPFVAFQMDIVVPDGFEMKGVNLRNGSRGHVVNYAKVRENTYRVVAYSLSNTALDYSAGLLDINVQPVAANALDDHQLTIINACVVDEELQERRLPSLTVDIDMDATSLNDVDASIDVEGGRFLRITAAKQQLVEIVSSSGQVVKVVEVGEGVTNVNLIPGVYVVCGKKIVII